MPKEKIKNSKSLVIVESPAKARTISKFLGANYSIVASMGHIIDLPQKKLGVDLENNFMPTYVVLASKKKILQELKKESKNVQKIYLATDPDREGEAIGWHLKENLAKDKVYLRVSFHEITKSAIEEAFQYPVDIDLNRVNAQQARRVLDRVVGYLLSPLLWKKIASGLSAGRVQSVALRLIVDRERKINAFVPEEYWEINAELKKITGEQKIFIAKLDKIHDQKIEIKNKEEADLITKDIENKKFQVSGVRQKEAKRNPSAPFITSTLQQDAFNKLGFTTSKTMLLAQQLYEGIELGKEGAIGLITYMRTDSPKVSNQAINSIRDYILKTYGKEYLPASPNIYKSKKQAQEAHEAIRPTIILNTPEKIKQYLNEDQYLLYELIYKKFVASQMNPVIYLQTSVDILAEKYLFIANGSRMIFKGFSIVYQDLTQEKEDRELPELIKDELLNLIKLGPSQHFTKPPPRFSESSLVKALEEEGIGRPSTYAPIIYTLVQRDYVRRTKGYFNPTELGMKVSDILVEYFPKIMDIKFTALMEEELDGIEDGKLIWTQVVSDFYKPFSESLEIAKTQIKKEIIPTDEVCELCGKPMVIKWGRRGKFLSCSDFPKCKFAKSINTGIKCPEAGCSGFLIQRRSKRGIFYGCTRYPDCKYIAKRLPQSQ